MESMMETGVVGTLVCWAMALAGIVLWVVCAGAKAGEGCEPEHDCSNCGHCGEHGMSAACTDCVPFYPSTPKWKSIDEPEVVK